MNKNKTYEELQLELKELGIIFDDEPLEDICIALADENLSDEVIEILEKEY